MEKAWDLSPKEDEPNPLFEVIGKVQAKQNERLEKIENDLEEALKCIDDLAGHLGRHIDMFYDLKAKVEKGGNK